LDLKLEQRLKTRCSRWLFCRHRDAIHADVQAVVGVQPLGSILNRRLIEPGFELTKPSTGQDYTVNIQESKIGDTS
jgi:hypothetical protein